VASTNTTGRTLDRHGADGDRSGIECRAGDLAIKARVVALRSPPLAEQTPQDYVDRLSSDVQAFATAKGRGVTDRWPIIGGGVGRRFLRTAVL
jgi:hypothetical protein